MKCPMIPNNYPLPIIYYPGTFDPAHAGHLATLKTTMEATQAGLAVILVDETANPNKPDRSSWESRRETAIRTFGSLDNVYISNLSKDKTKEELLKNNHVIVLIGSDTWPLYSERSKIKFDALCITTRDNEDTCYPKTLAGKSIIHLAPPIQGCSSSKIRKHLQSHPEIYTNAPIPKNTILDYLPRATLDFILETKLYYQSKEARLEKIHQMIKQHVAEHIFQGKQFELICLTSMTCNNDTIGEQSGDLTFLASYQEKKVFIKAYIKSSHIHDCDHEKKGILLLNSLSLSWAKSVSSIYSQENYPDYSYIATPYCDKQDLQKIFKNIHDTESEQVFTKMCFYVGRALSELHHHRSFPAQQESLQKSTEIFNTRTSGRLKNLPLEKQQKFEPSLDDSYANFMKNPGVHTYVHGDANPSNFIVDEETGTVYFLDLEQFSIQQSNDGSPLGLPAEDYHRFLNGIAELNKTHSLPASVVTSAQEAFKKGYDTFPSSITSEAHRYFSNYWVIRNYKIQEEDPV